MRLLQSLIFIHDKFRRPKHVAEIYIDEMIEIYDICTIASLVVSNFLSAHKSS
jgi:hypothetical protein